MRKALMLVLGVPLAMLLVVALFLVLRNVRDERLGPAVARVLANAHADVPPEENLYFELLAFDVREAPAPADVGRAMVRRYLEARPGASQSGHEWNLDPAVHRSPFAGDRLDLCSPDPANAPCLERAAGHAAELSALLDANRWLLERYKRVARYGRLEYPVPLAPWSPLPEWRAFMTGKQLLLTEIALGASAGHADAMASRLRDDARFTRRLLAAQDITLIDKMVLGGAYRQDLQLAGELVRLRTLTQVGQEAIAELAAPVTEAERSLTGPYAREFEVVRAVLAPLADPSKAAQFLEAAPARHHGAGVLGRVARFFYHPNATLNLAWSQTLSLQEAAGQPCEKQARRSSSADAPAQPSPLETYNPIGRRLVANSLWAYRTYSHRLCELVKLQRLVALHLAIRARAIPDERIPAFILAGGEAYRDPLSGDPFRFDAEHRAFDVHFEDRGFAGLGPWPL